MLALASRLMPLLFNILYVRLDYANTFLKIYLHVWRQLFITRAETSQISVFSFEALK